ncbi:hypothetical protein ACW9H6_13645 [Pseudomonas sp. SDO528_S397]
MRQNAPAPPETPRHSQAAISAATDPILVMGAGELGMAVLRALAVQPTARVAVMLLPSSVDATPGHQRQALGELSALGLASKNCRRERVSASQ